MASRQVDQSRGHGGPSRTDVWKMFDRVAPRYDLLNRLLSMGMDCVWRKKMATYLPPGHHLRVLDLATGTADQLLFLFEKKEKVCSGIGMDLAEKMLELGRQKVARRGLSGGICLQVGDAMNIPAGEDQFDAVTISFGIRNMADVTQALREMQRVLKPGGRVLILEFSLPGNSLVRRVYLLYLRHVIPWVGAIISGDPQAYRYLNATIETFPYGQAFLHLLESEGFAAAASYPLTFGIATIYCGDKPQGKSAYTQN